MFLRELVPEDAAVLLAWLQCEQVNRWLEGDMYSLTLQDIDNFILKCMLTDEDAYRIICHETGVFLGLAGIRRNGQNNGELSLGLTVEAQGKGYAAQAADILLTYAFGKMGLEYVWARVHPQNRPALAFCAKYYLDEGNGDEGYRNFRLNSDDFYERRGKQPDTQEAYK